MSRTSASKVDEVRCKCGKCLAKKGKIKCTRCGNFADARRAVAMAEASHALSAFVLANAIGGGATPVKISIRPRAQALGYVQYTPEPVGTLFDVTRLKAQLTAACAQAIVEREQNHVGVRTFEVMQHLANMIVSVTQPNLSIDGLGTAISALIDEHFALAEKLLADNKEAIDDLVKVLIQKGELSHSELQAFLSDRARRPS